MNPIFNNFTNPLQEHLVSQVSIKRQNSFIGYCFVFCLGFVVCYVVMKNQTPRTKIEEK
jgi:hypothetical protein